jgi:hypothetical protein
MAARWPSLHLDERRHRWVMNAKDERDFRAFLRNHKPRWSVLVHNPLHKPTFEIAKARANFAIEGLGMSPEEYAQGPYGAH